MTESILKGSVLAQTILCNFEGWNTIKIRKKKVQMFQIPPFKCFKTQNNITENKKKYLLNKLQFLEKKIP